MGERAFVMPTTTPVQFDPKALHDSIEKLCAKSPQAMYLTHYSKVADVPRLAADLHRLIDEMVVVAEGARVLQGEAQYARIRAGLDALVRKRVGQAGMGFTGRGSGGAVQG